MKALSFLPRWLAGAGWLLNFIVTPVDGRRKIEKPFWAKRFHSCLQYNCRLDSHFRFFRFFLSFFLFIMCTYGGIISFGKAPGTDQPRLDETSWIPSYNIQPTNSGRASRFHFGVGKLWDGNFSMKEKKWRGRKAHHHHDMCSHYYMEMTGWASRSKTPFWAFRRFFRFLYWGLYNAPSLYWPPYILWTFVFTVQYQ